jgi:hypothetical protein
VKHHHPGPQRAAQLQCLLCQPPCDASCHPASHHVMRAAILLGARAEHSPRLLPVPAATGCRACAGHGTARHSPAQHGTARHSTPSAIPAAWATTRMGCQASSAGLLPPSRRTLSVKKSGTSRAHVRCTRFWRSRSRWRSRSARSVSSWRLGGQGRAAHAQQGQQGLGPAPARPTGFAANTARSGGVA